MKRALDYRQLVQQNSIYRKHLEELVEARTALLSDAIADLVGADELFEEYIVPSMFDRRVADAVAAATREAAWSSGVARRARPGDTPEGQPAVGDLSLARGEGLGFAGG